MRSLLALTLVSGLFVFAPGPSRAQTPYNYSYRVSDYFAAPGLYGTSYGFASYGIPRTYTTFSAYPGPFYGSNLRGYGYLAGRYGVGLWRPGFVAPGYVYGSPSVGFSYGTFPVVSGTGLAPGQIAPPPPMGVYAPAFGPGVGLFGQ
ncbi:MAG: hypothetical protein ACP5XB_23340 [Isosphaeraceae bacterium]